MLRLIFGMLFPNVARRLGVTAVRKDVSAFFMKVVKDTIHYRETNNVTRKDFMQILIDLKNQNSDALTVEEAAAQCYIFFLGGFETSSTVMTFIYTIRISKKPPLTRKIET
mgnify:FL=1